MLTHSGDAEALRLTTLTDARVALRCEAFGLSPPPVRARVEVAHRQGLWRLSLEPEGDLAPLVAWVETVQPSQIIVGRDRRVSAYVQSLAPALALLAQDGIHEAILEPSGEVTIEARGRREDLRDLLTQMEGAAGRLDVQHVGPPPPLPRLLTQGQHEAICAAVEAGYYKIPRALNLNMLAGHVGVSPASLSERLRRAEARLVQDYMARTDPLVGRTLPGRRS